jgi:CubicO group peptidase (beta-lactamase class C family)
MVYRFGVRLRKWFVGDSEVTVCCRRIRRTGVPQALPCLPIRTDNAAATALRAEWPNVSDACNRKPDTGFDNLQRMLFRELLLCLASSAVLFAQGEAARVDQLFQKWANPQTPGASVAVVRDGTLVFAKGYGRANLEYDVPITADTLFEAGSNAKQFTAMSIVLLEQAGKLSLEDEVHKYLPELPNYGQPITIRELLQHTSGVRDSLDLCNLAGWNQSDAITQKQLLDLLFRQRELNFSPGTNGLYSNGGYLLLAEIVARVSGKPLSEFADEHIFRPLDMSHTRFQDDYRRVVPGRAYSYLLWDGAYLATPLNTGSIGPVGLWTTATDLVKWLDNFRSIKVGGARAVARMQETAGVPVNLGGREQPSPATYGLGVVIGEYRGLRTISHAGNVASYRSAMVWYPDQRFGVAVLANGGSFTPVLTANSVAAIYLEKQLKPEPKAPALKRDAATAGERVVQTLFEPRDLGQYTGRYWSDELDTSYAISLRDGKLIARHLRNRESVLNPLREDEFGTTSWYHVRFTRDKGGAITGMVLSGNRTTGIEFLRQ